MNERRDDEKSSQEATIHDKHISAGSKVQGCPEMSSRSKSKESKVGVDVDKFG
jgi:hypothetical protein